MMNRNMNARGKMDTLSGIRCFTFILRFLQLTQPDLDFLCDRRLRGILSEKTLHNNCNR